MTITVHRSMRTAALLARNDVTKDARRNCGHKARDPWTGETVHRVTGYPPVPTA